MHYKNGREAKVGDLVIGTVFNNGGALTAGTLISLTPSCNDSCSAMVGYCVTVSAEQLEAQSPKGGHLMVNGVPMYNVAPVKVAGDEQHGSGGKLTVTYFATDYTECKNLLHVEDAWAASIPLLGVSGQPPIDNDHVAEGCETFGAKA